MTDRPQDPIAADPPTVRAYAAASFRMPEEGAWRALLAGAPFALLSHIQPDGTVQASWLPLLPVPGTTDLVEGHLARANPLARAVQAAGPAGLAVQVAVLGTHGYVSPRWYKTDKPAVPTWNYEAAFLSARAVVHDDPAAVEGVVSRLADAFEADAAADGPPWRFADRLAEYRAGMLNGIVAFDLTVSAAQSVAKLSQNRSREDRAGVIDGLRSSPRSGDRELAARMAARDIAAAGDA